MNDLTSLRGPRLAPPPGALDRALTTGRARLRRRRIAGAATTSCVALLAVVALGSGPGTQSLDQADPAAPGGASPTAGTASPRAMAEPSARPSPVLPGTGLVPTGIPIPLPQPSASERPQDPTASPSRSETRRYVGIGSREVTITMRNDPAACAGEPWQVQWVPTTGYCTTMTGPDEVTVGERATYAFTLCRAPGQEAATLTFRTRQEALFHAYEATGDADDGQHWRLGWPDRDGPRHTVTFEPGDCRTWRADWMGQDDDGYAFPDTYVEMLGFPAADEFVTEEGTTMTPEPSSVMVTVRS